jgi:hypothetical protein
MEKKINNMGGLKSTNIGEANNKIIIENVNNYFL